MSSAFLYIAIVAIWAFVLIPRWLRRPHVVGGENTDHESTPQETSASREFGEVAPERSDEHDARGEAPAAAYDVPHVRAAPTAARSRVLHSRRRLLAVLVTLMVLAATCTYLKLTSWVLCVPPAGMLGLYLLLLREAALADAQRARSRMAEEHQSRPARARARPARAAPSTLSPPLAPLAPPADTAQVIDISARLGDQLYDQYADATMRAVGD